MKTEGIIMLVRDRGCHLPVLELLLLLLLAPQSLVCSADSPVRQLCQHDAMTVQCPYAIIIDLIMHYP